MLLSASYALNKDPCIPFLNNFKPKVSPHNPNAHSLNS